MRLPSGVGAGLEESLLELGFVQVPKLGRTAWRAQLEGRSCEVSVMVQKRTRYVGEVRVRGSIGVQLRAELATAVPARLYFVRQRVAQNPIVRLVYRLRRYAVGAMVGELAAFSVVGPDGVWAERLCGDREAMAAVGPLLREGATPTYAGSLSFAPTPEGSRIEFSSPILQAADLTADRVGLVLDRLVALARAAERVGPPATPAAPSPLELFGRKHPWAVALGILGCLLASVGGLALVAVTIAALSSR